MIVLYLQACESGLIVSLDESLVLVASQGFLVVWVFGLNQSSSSADSL